jgi:hypothetical protein
LSVFSLADKPAVYSCFCLIREWFVSVSYVLVCTFLLRSVKSVTNSATKVASDTSHRTATQFSFMPRTCVIQLPLSVKSFTFCGGPPHGLRDLVPGNTRAAKAQRGSSQIMQGENFLTITRALRNQRIGNEIVCAGSHIRICVFQPASGAQKGRQAQNPDTSGSSHSRHHLHNCIHAPDNA